jgi:hypothetical protein
MDSGGNLSGTVAAANVASFFAYKTVCLKPISQLFLGVTEFQ